MAKFLVAFPWIDREEVRNVYKELRGTDVNAQKHALGRIAVWKCRARGRLPVAVESTEALFRAQLECENIGSRDELYIRNIYSLALIRFINHITERGQQKFYARPVHAVASEIGVPDWIVELRHMATHRSLPSLSELKAASKWAINWLENTFWKPQIEETFLLSSLKSASVEMLEDALVIYMQKKFEGISSGRKIDTQQEIEDMNHIFEQLGSSACTVLLQEGYMILTETQLNALGFSSAEILQDESLLLPSKIVNFWKKVINLLYKSELVPELLLHMLSVISPEKSLKNKLLYSWLYTILLNNSEMEQNSNMFDYYTDLPYRTIFEKCSQLGYSDTGPVLNLIIDKVEISSEQKQQIQRLMSICRLSVSSCDSHKLLANGKICSVTDLSPLLTDLHQCPWNKASNIIDWAEVPFGILPNQKVSYRSLEIGSSYGINGVITGKEDQENDTEMEAILETESTEIPSSRTTDFVYDDTEKIAASHQWNEESFNDDIEKIAASHQWNEESFNEDNEKIATSQRWNGESLQMITDQTQIF